MKTASGMMPSLFSTRVDAVDADQIVVARLLERPAPLEEAHAERDDRDLHDARA